MASAGAVSDVKPAQHSVHPTPGKERRGHGGGSLRVFKQFAWLKAGSSKAALSRPAHQPVTRAVGRRIVDRSLVKGKRYLEEVVNERKGFRIVPFGFNRQMVTASAAVSKEKDTIHLITEVDITRPRQLISKYLELNHEKLSLTGYVVSCLARTINEFPQFNSFRKGNKLITLDNLTISVLFEREINGESVPEPVGIQNACKKDYHEINDELRSSQRMRVEHLGAATNAAWVRFIPVFLLKIFVRLASKSIRMQMRYGVVGVTAVGMFGAGSLWLVPLTNATITVAIGSISKKPVLIDGNLQEREFLCLTISFDHDIVDGAPAARFTRRFSELLSSGMEISKLMSDGSS